MVFWLWTRLRNSDCRRSRPRKNRKFPRNSSVSLKFSVVPKTKLFDQAYSGSSKYSQSAQANGDAGWSTFKCRRKRHGHKRVSSVWPGRFWVSLGRSWLEHGCSVPSRHISPDSRSTFKEFEVASRAENPIPIDDEENNEKNPRFQQSLSPRDQPNPLCSREVAPLEQELRISLITLKEICYVNL